MSSAARCMFAVRSRPALILPAGDEPVSTTDIRVLQEQPIFQHVEVSLHAHIVRRNRPAGLISAAADWTVSQYRGPTCAPEPSRCQPQAPVASPRT